MIALAEPRLPARFAKLPAAAPRGRHYLVIGWYRWGRGRKLTTALTRCGPDFDPAADRCTLYHCDPRAWVDGDGEIRTPMTGHAPLELAFYP